MLTLDPVHTRFLEQEETGGCLRSFSDSKHGCAQLILEGQSVPYSEHGSHGHPSNEATHSAGTRGLFLSANLSPPVGRILLPLILSNEGTDLLTISMPYGYLLVTDIIRISHHSFLSR